MAPALSKLTQLPFNCYEIGHTWTSSCTQASADLGLDCFKESLKIYTTCYIFSLLASRRYPKSFEECTKVMKDVLRSSSFLTGNAVGYITLFCLLRKLLGHHNFYTLGIVPAFFASYGAILIEKPNRRSLLALYVTNVASETIFRMLRSRGILRNVKNFDFFLFVVSISTLLYQMKKRAGRNDIVDVVLKKIVGAEEFDMVRPSLSLDSVGMGDRVTSQQQRRLDSLSERNEAILGQREVNNVGPGLLIGGPEVPVELPESNEHPEAAGDGNRLQQNIQRAITSRQNDETYRRRFIKFVLWMHRQVEDIACHLERMVAAIYDGRIHDTCPHKKPCFDYWFDGFWTRFASGFGIQFAFETALLIKQFILSSKSLPRPSRSRTSPAYTCIKSGVGLGAFCLTFRLLSCSFRWLLGNEDCSHAIPSSVMATALGFVLIKPPPTLGLYLFFKGIQSAVTESHRQNNWKIIRWIDSVFGGGWCLLYAISTAILFHAGVFEPQNLKPSYYNFLSRITGGKLFEINRHLMSIYGTNSNLLMKHFWPQFDHRYLSPLMRKLLEERELSVLKGAGNNEFMQELVTKVLIAK